MTVHMTCREIPQTLQLKHGAQELITPAKSTLFVTPTTTCIILHLTLQTPARTLKSASTSDAKVVDSHSPVQSKSFNRKQVIDVIIGRHRNLKNLNCMLCLCQICLQSEKQNIPVLSSDHKDSLKQRKQDLTKS